MSTIFPGQPEERDITGLKTVFDPETLVKKGTLPTSRIHTRDQPKPSRCNRSLPRELNPEWLFTY